MESPLLLILAKAPQLGAVKTRLCPPLSDLQAYRLYEAFLGDTLEQARNFGVRRVIAYAGDPDWFTPWRGHYELVEQQGTGLDERLWNAFRSFPGPTVCIGSDSPHLVNDHLWTSAMARLETCPVAIGPSLDGGYYLVALREPVDLFCGLPMSTPRLLAETERRACTLGLALGRLEIERDLDSWEDVQSERERLPVRSSRVLAQVEAELAAQL